MSILLYIPLVGAGAKFFPGLFFISDAVSWKTKKWTERSKKRQAHCFVQQVVSVVRPDHGPPG
ncbi:MAG: hypothetical protein ACOC3F_00135, partial [Desulfosudaceae bacterium]